MARLREHYREKVVPDLTAKFGYKSPMEVPRITKITVNMGVGKGEQEPKTLENAVRDLALITGQKPVVTTAKQAIANFRIRQGHRIGCKVTLRGERMYIFLEKLVNIVLPRIRDFGGVSPRSFDGRGNYSLGLREQILFPEIVYDQVDRLRVAVQQHLQTETSLGDGEYLVGVGGTFVNLGCLHLRLPHHDSGRVHGDTLTLGEMRSLADMLCALPLSERRNLPGIEPDRAPVLHAGALIASTAMECLKANEIAVSMRGLRWGLIYEYADAHRD